MKLKAAIFTFLLGVGILVLLASQFFDSADADLSQLCINEIIADYFAKEKLLDLVNEVHIKDDSGSLLKLDEQYLNKIGVHLNTDWKNWHSPQFGFQNVTLSLLNIDGSNQPQLCSLIESGRSRKIWFYPIKQNEGRCEIERNNSGEFLLVEVKTKESVLINGEETGMGSIWPITAYISRKDKNGVRALVVLDFSIPYKYANQVSNQILAGEPNATIIAMRRGKDGRIGKLVKWTEQAGLLNSEKPWGSLD